MTQEFNHQEAIKRAAQVEKDLMEFYQRAAEMTNNPGGRQVFETLARDEREHAVSFFSIYGGADLGSLDEFIGTPSHSQSVMMHKLEKMFDDQMDERRAMELALDEEESLEKNLRYTASQLIDPAARAVFERMADETHAHFVVIESEYARLMGMVHETDIDIYVRE